MRLHLGCGAKYIPGWYHVDVVDLPHINLRHSIDSLPMLLDGSASAIYVCHALEHFLRREVKRVLAEWFRILRPGTGVLRLAVPDFAAIAEEYCTNRNLNEVIGLLFGRQDGLYGFHNAVYDETVLTDLLTSVGYVNVRRYDWRSTEHAWLDDFSQAYLPHMNKDTGRLMSLNIEANRPQA